MASTSSSQEAKRILAAWVPVTLAEQIRARAETERQIGRQPSRMKPRDRREMAVERLSGCGREGPVTESARITTAEWQAAKKREGILAEDAARDRQP